ncbi:hypothetical protein ACFQGA_02055 [Marinobacter koreensis]|uniref:Transmembrane protein n=1 Tax=Marinobacter koreensis TaxID=335974 RepID=A0ABW0RPL5_9GAMM
MTMTTADRIPQEHRATGPTPAQVRRGRRTAYLLFALGFGPMILATVMYYTGWLNPAGHTNNGRLIQPAVPVSSLHLQTDSGEPLSKRFGPTVAEPQWLLIVVADQCGPDCQSLLYRTRQVNIALGKNANRVSRAAALGSIPPALADNWNAEYRLMERLSPAEGATPQWPDGVNPSRAPGILLVDPFGNLMMHYDIGNTGKGMLEDLKHLLKLSKIG